MRHPSGWQRPLRAAVAASAAWAIVQTMGGTADQYPYYAPLGAVVAITTTAAGSVRESARTMAAMVVGIALAVLTEPLPPILGILLVVGIGTALGALGSRWFGAAASWIPITGMFVLVIGGNTPYGYAGAYLGLTSLGTLVGVVVNLAWPPLPLRAEAQALGDVRAALSDLLESMADALVAERPPTPHEWAARTRDLDLVVAHMRETAATAHETRLLNWRVRRWTRAAGMRHRQARAFDRLALHVEDLADLLAEEENSEAAQVALGPELRPYASKVLLDLAAAMRSIESEGPVVDPSGASVDDEAVEAARRSLEELVDQMRVVRERTGDDLLTAGGVVTLAGRTLHTLTAVRPGEVAGPGQVP